MSFLCSSSFLLWCLLWSLLVLSPWAGRVGGGGVDWLVSDWQKPLSLSAASIYAQFSLWLPLTTCFNTNGPGENSQSKWSLYNLEMKYGKYKASLSLKTPHYIYKCLNIWSYVIFQGEKKIPQHLPQESIASWEFKYGCCCLLVCLSSLPT